MSMTTLHSYEIKMRQHGFTLLEALLTLFILTIGILGVAGLQMRAMSSGGMAMQRTVVLLKSQDLLERMRVNSASLASYTGAGVDNQCHVDKVCSGAELAANDLFLWLEDMQALLPNTASIDPEIQVVPGATATTPSTVTVTVNWVDRTDNLSYSVQALILPES